MPGYRRRRLFCSLLAGLAMLAALVTIYAIAPAAAHPLRGELYYTRYLGAPNVNKIPFAFDGKAVTLGRKVPVANLVGADGLGFAADGRLIVGGQGDRVHAVRIGVPGGRQSVSAGGAKVFHVAIDPDGRRAWLTGTPGQLVELPLEPFADGVPRALQGDDTAISALAFDGAGRAYYTTGDDRGAGHFGTIDLKTFTTSRMIAGLTAAHHLTYDSLTRTLFLFGGSEILQIDPLRPREIMARLSLDQPSRFDQGTADGKGHLFIARVDGHLVFIDMAATGRLDAPENHVEAVFVDSNLDDFAPLAGPGAQPKNRLASSGGNAADDADAADPDGGGDGDGAGGDGSGGSGGGAGSAGAGGGSAGGGGDAGAGGGDANAQAPAGGGAAGGGLAGDNGPGAAGGGSQDNGKQAGRRGGAAGGAAGAGAGIAAGAGGGRAGGGGGAAGAGGAVAAGGGRPFAQLADAGDNAADDGAPDSAQSADGESGEAGGEQAAGPSAASPKAVALQGLAVLLLALGASLGLRLGEKRGPLTAWTAFAGGVAAAGPGYTIVRYFDFLSDEYWRGLASRDPGAVEALAVAALVVAGAVWLFMRTRAARGRGGADRGASGGLTGQALENAIEAALGRAISATGSRIGFIGRFAPGKGRRDLRLLAMRDGTSGGGGAGGKRLTPEQLGVLLDHQEIGTRPIIADGPRDEAIQRWLPKPLPEVKALLGVPIVERDEPVGLLGLSNSPHGYDDAAVAKVKPIVDELRGLLAESGDGGQSETDAPDAGAEDDEDAAPAEEGKPGRSKKKKKAKKKKRGSSRRKGILRGTSPWRVASGRKT